MIQYHNLFIIELFGGFFLFLKNKTQQGKFHSTGKGKTEGNIGRGGFGVAKGGLLKLGI